MFRNSTEESYVYITENPSSMNVPWCRYSSLVFVLQVNTKFDVYVKPGNTISSTATGNIQLRTLHVLS